LAKYSDKTKQPVPDFTFLVEGKSLPAHKEVLSARSDKLKAMLESGLQESIQSQITIKDSSYYVFSLFLDFLYTDKLELEIVEVTKGKQEAINVAIQLLYLADQYFLTRLGDFCSSFIAKYTDDSNWHQIAETASVTHNEQLLIFCAHYASGRKNQLQYGAANFSIDTDLETLMNKYMWD